MQYGIKSGPYLVFLHFGAEKGYVGLNVLLCVPLCVLQISTKLSLCSLCIAWSHRHFMTVLRSRWRLRRSDSFS